ncbi:hypothetical protein PHMEG_00026064 [Phytophthora megakarya]|uniref:RING-type domain-containing protein n=1 Tax=Phytophthora megakarya TaxID=4795 RepID=A0A225VAH0_9STRA|nr:hypothetical protein PHMEG_00026064 [Phytophthora megakarya]
MAFDARTVTVKLAELTEHLGCALCNGILRDAHTIPDCLHSFCKSCIYRHFLVKGSCVCPKCNKKLNPLPTSTLITDQKLQDVVDRIFPEFKEEEALLEKEFYTKNDFKMKDESELDGANGSSSAPGTPSITRSKSKKLTPAPQDSVSSGKQFPIQVYPQQSYVLKLLPELKFPFMQVNGNLKMSELRKLLHKRLKLPDEVQLEIACMGTAVGPELSVHFIQRTIWQHQNQTGPLVLHYRHLTS